MVYDYLEEFIYENLAEAEDGISEEKPHYFIKADNEIDQDIKRLEERLKIQMPSELKHFHLCGCNMARSGNKATEI